MYEKLDRIASDSEGSKTFRKFRRLKPVRPSNAEITDQKHCKGLRRMAKDYEMTDVSEDDRISTNAPHFPKHQIYMGIQLITKEVS